MRHSSTISFAASIAIAFFLLFAASPIVSNKAAAQNLCSEPLVPLCAQGVTTLDSEQQEIMCLEDLERYQGQLEEYGQCMLEGAEWAERKLVDVKAYYSCLTEKGFGNCDDLR